MKLISAEPQHLDHLVPLFDGYRQFYGRTSDTELARDFLSERLQRKDTYLIFATSKDQPAGFVQLFPSFSSVAAQRILILNDLYVDPAYRRQGIGKALMNGARRFSIENGYRGLKLETQEHNLIGQKLYESLGYLRQLGFYQYFLPTAPRRGVFDFLKKR